MYYLYPAASPPPLYIRVYFDIIRVLSFVLCQYRVFERLESIPMITSREMFYYTYNNNTYTIYTVYIYIYIYES